MWPFLLLVNKKAKKKKKSLHISHCDMKVGKERCWKAHTHTHTYASLVPTLNNVKT